VIRMWLVELRRFLWRRSFRVFGLVALAGILLAVVITFFTADTQDDPQATAFYEQPVQQCVQSFPDPGSVPPGFDNAEEFCREEGIPVHEFDNRFRLTELTDVLEGMSVLLIILGLAFGASFIGAEWHSGTITTLLTWESRRTRVMVTKVLAIAFGVFLAALSIQAVLGLLLWPVAVFRGTLEGTTWPWFVETLALAARGAFVAGLAAAIGFAIASLARNTTTALIIGFVYFAVAESIVRGLRPNWQHWLLGDNAAAYVIASPDQVFSIPGRTTLSALLVVVGYAVGAVAVATTFFRARDVT
jgi:ABC-type transport system involved in multi-copper enzyme maturation permease subunit